MQVCKTINQSSAFDIAIHVGSPHWQRITFHNMVYNLLFSIHSRTLYGLAAHNFIPLVIIRPVVSVKIIAQHAPSCPAGPPRQVGRTRGPLVVSTINSQSLLQPDLHFLIAYFMTNFGWAQPPENIGNKACLWGERWLFTSTWMCPQLTSRIPVAFSTYHTASVIETIGLVAPLPLHKILIAPFSLVGLWHGEEYMGTAHLYHGWPYVCVCVPVQERGRQSSSIYRLLHNSASVFLADHKLGQTYAIPWALRAGRMWRVNSPCHFLLFTTTNTMNKLNEMKLTVSHTHWWSGHFSDTWQHWTASTQIIMHLAKKVYYINVGNHNSAMLFVFCDATTSIKSLHAIQRLWVLIKYTF